jgi:ribonuclease Z
MDLSIFFVGTGGSAPTARRGLPSALVRRGGDRIMFDCGEGTQRQLVSTIGLTELTEIYVTHFHADHWLGLPGMLKTFDLRGRERPLTIHGPRGLQTLLGLAMRMAGRIGFDLHIVELVAGDVLERDGYRIAPVPVSHRGPAFGYVLFEDDRPGMFDPHAAVQLGLEPGPEFGRVQRGETVRGVSPEQVMGPARPGRKLVLSGDTAPCEALRVAAHRADVLVHEATFAEEERDRAALTGHSTAVQAATLAAEAEVALLALNHVSTRHPLGLLRDEARAVFEHTVIPRDFDTIEIPFGERGQPVVLRWEENAEPTKPAEPAEPTKPAEPAEPTKPAEPAASRAAT